MIVTQPTTSLGTPKSAEYRGGWEAYTPEPLFVNFDENGAGVMVTRTDAPSVSIAA
jgi:hypothetical protein